MSQDGRSSDSPLCQPPGCGISDGQVTLRLRNRAIDALVPFFLEGKSDDVVSARAVAGGILKDYNAATPKELQLATEIIACGWAAMACLRTAMAAKNLSVPDVLRLQSDAIALDRAAHKATKALDTRRRERVSNQGAMTPESGRWEEGAFQLAINQAMEKLNNANSKLAAYMATITPVAKVTKLPILSAEQMTPSVLARRARG